MNETVKRYISVIITVTVLMTALLLCSCGDARFSDMKRYVNEHSDVRVTSIYMVGDTEYVNECLLNKQVLLEVALASGKQHYSIDELESLRIALNDYMTSDPDSYINKGYHVVVWVHNTYYLATEGPISRCAVFSNSDSLYVEYYTDLNDSLCTAMYKPYKEDVSMLGNILNVKYLWLIDEGYSYEHNESFPIDAINEAAPDLNGIRVLYIDENYYDRFDASGLEYKVEKGSY